MVFLTVCKQTGVGQDGNAQFNWENGIVCKLGENDLGEILAVCERRTQSAGYNGSLFHETPGGGNKVIKFSKGDKGFIFSVSAQDKNKNKIPPVSLVLSDADVATMSVLIKRALEKIYGW